MPSRAEFFTSEYALRECAVSLQNGNDIKTISVAQAYLDYLRDHQKAHMYPPRLLFIYIKSLLRLREFPSAQRLIQCFLDEDFVTRDK